MEEKKPEKEEGGERVTTQVTTYLARPPDGGWGWVIVAASFMCNLIVDGIVFSFGAFLDHIHKEFKVSFAQVTLAGSLLSGVYMIIGPFVSGLANRYGFRKIAIGGSFVGALAFILASYSPSIEFLWISYGLLGGVGFGLIYVPAVIACGFYFEKWRALATGISVCGSGIGTIVMMPFTTFLINRFGWRHTLLIQAGIVFSCSIFGALFRPLKPELLEVQDPEAEEPLEDPSKIPLMQRIKMARDQLRRADSAVSIENDISIAAVPPVETNRFLKANHNATYPTAAEILHNSANSLAKSRHSLCSNQNYLKNNKDAQKRYSIPMDNTKIAECANNEANVDDPLLHENQDEVVLMTKKHSKTAILESGARRDSITFRYRTRTMSESSHKSGQRSRRNTLSKIEVGVRPLYREDIFLQASLNRVPQFTSHGSGLDYTMSVSRLPTWKDVQEEEDASCQLCPEAVRRTLATMLNFSLLTSPTFLLFSLAGFVTMMGLFIPFMYLSSRAQEQGIDVTMAVTLVSSIGITNTVGRIICGGISSLPGVNSLLINNIALTVGGLVTMFSGFSSSLTYQFSFTLLFGLSIACFASLRSIIIVDLMGLENLTNAFGLLLLFQGVAAVIGAPIAGAFQDLTGSYDASFYLSGGLLLLSGVMCYPLNWLNNWEKRRAEMQQSETSDSTSKIKQNP